MTTKLAIALARVEDALNPEDLPKIRALTSEIDAAHNEADWENTELRKLVSQQRMRIAELERHLHGAIEPHNHPVHD